MTIVVKTSIIFEAAISVWEALRPVAVVPTFYVPFVYRGDNG